MPNRDDDIEQATRRVLDYCAAINDWETRRFFRSRLERGYEFTVERDRRLAGPLSAEALDAEYVVIFREHCTDRKRKWSGFPSSYGHPPRYADASEDTVLEASRPSPGRVEIAVRCGNMPDIDHRFVLLKQKGRWLVDSVQWRLKGGRWERGVL